MKNDAYKFAALAVLLVFVGAALYIYRPVENRLTRVTVVGDAETKAEPDTAVISLSVVTEARQAVAAQQENARKADAVAKAIEAATAGTKTEIETSDYGLMPERDYTASVPRIRAYRATNTLTVSIGDMERVGAVIDAATAAGANSVEGISFVVGGDSPGQGNALASATKQAMTKAEALAAALNGRIARVVQSTEGGIHPAHVEASYGMMANASSFEAADKRIATPVRAGTQSLRSQVILIVDIEVNRE